MNCTGQAYALHPSPLFAAHEIASCRNQIIPGGGYPDNQGLLTGWNGFNISGLLYSIFVTLKWSKVLLHGFVQNDKSLCNTRLLR